MILIPVLVVVAVEVVGRSSCSNCSGCDGYSSSCRCHWYCQRSRSSTNGSNSGSSSDIHAITTVEAP